MNAFGRFSSSGTLVRATMGVLLSTACAIDGSTGVSSGSGSARATPAVAATDASVCPDCIFGVETFVRTTGAPSETTVDFTALQGQAYVAELSDLGGIGAIGEVTLNGGTLISLGRSPNGRPPSGVTAVTLASSNRLAVRLVGRPGSGFRVAIRAVRPVTLDAVTLAPGTPVELEGAGVPFEFTAANYTKWPRQNIGIQAWVSQGSAIRAAGGQALDCGGALGELRPGRCTGLATLRPSNANEGSGALVAGTANARLDLVALTGEGNVVLDSRLVPVMLLAPPTPGVVQVSVNPPVNVPRFGSLIFMGIGSEIQLTADVQVTGNAPQSVTWSSSNPQIATVSSTGWVTGVSPGDVTIRATSSWDVTKSGSMAVHVYALAMRSPPNGTSVSTGATTPPANPLSVLLKAEACGPTAIFPNPFARLDFVVLRPGSSVLVIGSVSPAGATVTDNGAERCWGYAHVWTPGTTVGTGTLPVAAIGHLGGGRFAAGTPTGFSITITDP